MTARFPGLLPKQPAAELFVRMEKAETPSNDRLTASVSHREHPGRFSLRDAFFGSGGNMPLPQCRFLTGAYN
jgi:hypothetical protein